MSFVATLMTHSSNPILSNQLGDDIAHAVSASDLCWLGDNIACDIILPDRVNLTMIENTIAMMVKNLPIDMAIQEAKNRRKKILIADMDSTMIEQECIDELADEVGLKDDVSHITAQAMNGEIEFETALRARVKLLKGLPLDVVHNIIKTRITLMEGAKTLVATMKNNGAYCALVSGGFTVFTHPIAKMIGFDEHRANVLLEQQGVLSGQVADPISGEQAKVNALNEISRLRGYSPQDAIAIGDGANDLAMLRQAGTGVAIHAKPFVAEKARIRLDYSDLTALLYLQGYQKSDFIT